MAKIIFLTKYAILLFSTAIIAIFLTTCKSINLLGGKSTQPDVYVAGYIEMPGDGEDEVVRTVSRFTGRDTTVVIPSESKFYAVVWKNGVAQYLTDGTEYAHALSVFVYGDDVYVAGYEGDFAMLWKNGVAHKLTDGTVEARANSVFVSGTDVFIAGYEGKYDDTEQIAKLWKNGVAQNLTVGAVIAQAISVFVSGKDVYVALNERGPNDGAKIWKNGELQNLGDAWINSIFVADNDVYVTGSRANRFEFEGLHYSVPFAQLWKNGVAQNLFEERDVVLASKEDLSNVDISWTNSVFINGNDLYVLGGVGKFGHIGAVMLWKNGEAKVLHEGFYGERSIFVHNDDVYVTERRGVFKNGVKQYLAVDETARGSDAYSVFVKYYQKIN